MEFRSGGSWVVRRADTWHLGSWPFQGFLLKHRQISRRQISIQLGKFLGNFSPLALHPMLQVRRHPDPASRTCRTMRIAIGPSNAIGDGGPSRGRLRFLPSLAQFLMPRPSMSVTPLVSGASSSLSYVVHRKHSQFWRNPRHTGPVAQANFSTNFCALRAHRQISRKFLRAARAGIF